jgi:ubiquitin C-terminal hydrolase
MNVLVQCLYFSMDFRTGIYDWVRHREAAMAGKAAAKPNMQAAQMRALALLFANMQHNTRSYHKPLAFTTMMKLTTRVQQDVCEFLRKLVEHIEVIMQRLPVPGHNQRSGSSLIRDLLQGKHAYVTRCLSCGHSSPPEIPFYDIQAHLSGCASLADGIRRSLQPSFISGADRYLCSRCGCKRDAVRYQELRKLPPLLTVNLERFAFDFETLERRKSSEAIKVRATTKQPPLLVPPKPVVLCHSPYPPPPRRPAECLRPGADS